ncbi:MAG: VanZ family protein [Clostridia bacterium]|nr:VanZ family protein [Clostridia bacterium]
MKNYSAKRKFGIVFGWAAVAACMGVIFSLSHQPAEESAELSMTVMNGIFAVFAWLTEFMGHEAFRTLAHGLEYCGLGALLFHAFLQTAGKPKPLACFAVAVTYAVSDEIHQIFIPGRAFQLSDIAVDATGAAAGIAVCVCIYKIVKKIIASRKPLADG